ncbi:MAG: MFS transporter [Acetobacteraceae bacterium]|nr:MFS transporter [Acetobacteraceae bacterium]MSP30146.1 MFS transporter [Acetobacteraceae bacterium]
MNSTTSIENRFSWIAAFTALGILAITYGSPLMVIVAMKSIAADLDTPRAVPALAASLGWLGAGLGGIAMGWVAERIGVRWVVMFGAVNICIGLGISSIGTPWALYIGQGLFMGLLGNAGLFAPLMTYVTHWFDRRRGTALALISSGQYIAGILWPTVFEYGNIAIGWQQTMLVFGILVAVLAVPIAFFTLRAPPPHDPAHAGVGTPQTGEKVLGLYPHLTMMLLAVAAFLCCVPMALPQQHLVAFCSDIGLAPGRGALMLSTLLAAAFIARQFWGWLSDKYGGLLTVLFGSAWQALSIMAFLATQDEVGLFAIAIAYGFGFSGIIPAYVLTVRQIFPVGEVGWRAPVVLFFGMSGMAFGGWFAGTIYDLFVTYAPAFGSGVVFNVANLTIILFLVYRWKRPRMIVSLDLAHA